MPAGKTSVALFAAFVAAALAAVAWLVLSGSPPPGKAGTDGPGPTPTPIPAPPPPPPPGPKGPKGDPRRNPRPASVALEVKGRVLAPSGVPEPGAEVVVFRPTREGPAGGSAAPPPPEEKVDSEVLRECFALTTEETATASWYSGIPHPPDSKEEAAEAGRVVTGPDGTFTLSVRERGPFRLEARKEGVGSAVADGVAANVAVEMKLGDEQALTGRVVRDSGSTPVEGAVVVVRSGRLALSARTGADGGFSIPGLPPGRYHLTAGAAGFAPTVLPSVPFPSTEPIEARLGLGMAVRVLVSKRDLTAPPARRGAMRSGPYGPPVEGATVVLFQRGTGSFRAAVTGADGVARIDRLGPGAWSVAARKEGFGIGAAPGLRLGPNSAPEESREVGLLPLVKTPLRFLDDAGAPLKNARIYTGGEDEELDERRSRLIGRTDAEGVLAVEFDDNVPWKAIAWVVPEGGGAAVKVEAEEPGQEQKVVVTKGRVVQGTVKDHRGRPVAAAEVTLMVTDDEPDVDIELRTASDAAGAFKFPEVPFGDVSIQAETADGDYGEVDIEEENRDSPLVKEIVIELEE